MIFSLFHYCWLCHVISPLYCWFTIPNSQLLFLTHFWAPETGSLWRSQLFHLQVWVCSSLYLAWPSFESFLLVLVATIMRALTIIAIESVAWWLASPRSLNLPGESLRGLNGKVIGDFPASRGHRRLTVDIQHFSIKKCGSESEAKYGYLTTLVPWKPCGSHLMPWTATTSRIRNN